MRITPPRWLINWLLSHAKHDPRTPPIYKGDSLYMERLVIIPYDTWWTLRIAARIHITHRSDADPHMHDHPWWNISWLLENDYNEEMPLVPESNHNPVNHKFTHRPVGSIVFRRATDRHRLHLGSGPVMSLFITGPWSQKWGFYTENGKVYYKDYLGIHDHDEWKEEQRA